MARASSPVEISSFAKGWNTDAGPLNYQPDSAIDITNFSIEQDGSLRRRLGMSKVGGADITGSSSTLTRYLEGDSKVLRTELWTGAGQSGRANILVVTSSSSSTPNTYQSKISFFVVGSTGLTPINSLTRSSDGTREIIQQVGKNIVISNHTPSVPDSFTVYEYDDIDRVVNPKDNYSIKVRDLWGLEAKYGSTDLNDESNYYLRPNQNGREASVAGFPDRPNHLYNLRNSGWAKAGLAVGSVLKVDPVERMGSLIGYEGTMPSYGDSLNDYTYPKTDDTFEPSSDKFHVTTLLENTPYSLTRPRGSMIINILSRGESRRDSLSNLYREIKLFPAQWFGEDELPSFSRMDDADVGEHVTQMEFFAGRLWFAGFNGKEVNPWSGSPNLTSMILFSQLNVDDSSLFKCYQEDDPNSKDSAGVVDTDGGFVNLEGVSEVTGLKAFGQSLLIFTSQGVWAVSGTDNTGFTATSYKVSKVTDRISNFSGSIVNTGDSLMYLSEEGVNVISRNQYGELVHTLTSAGVLDKYFESVGYNSLALSVGAASSAKGLVQWTIPSTDGTEILTINTRIGAFYKHLIKGSVTDGDVSVLSVLALPTNSQFDLSSKVVIGADQVTVGGDDVIIKDAAIVDQSADFVYTIGQLTSVVNAQYDYTLTYGFSLLSDSTFTDWESFTEPTPSPWVAPTPVDAEAEIITGYLTGGDTQRYKSMPYLTMLFNKTETGFEEVDGDLIPLNESSCLTQVRWGWTNLEFSNRWTREFQAYRERMVYMPEGSGDGYDDGNSVVISKNKIRGKGRALSVRMRTEPKKDMQLIGMSMVLGINGSV